MPACSYNFQVSCPYTAPSCRHPIVRFLHPGDVFDVFAVEAQMSRRTLSIWVAFVLLLMFDVWNASGALCDYFYAIRMSGSRTAVWLRCNTLIVWSSRGLQNQGYATFVNSKFV